MPNKNKAIGDRIKEVRKARGINQTELGGVLGGLTQAAISAYEGGRVPEAIILQQIAEWGNVTVDWLLTGEGVVYQEEKEKVDFVREGRYISEEDEELLKLLRENGELVGLLREYGKLKRCAKEVQMQVVLTPQVG